MSFQDVLNIAAQARSEQAQKGDALAESRRVQLAECVEEVTPKLDRRTRDYRQKPESNYRKPASGRPSKRSKPEPKPIDLSIHRDWIVARVGKMRVYELAAMFAQHTNTSCSTAQMTNALQALNLRSDGKPLGTGRRPKMAKWTGTEIS